MSNISDLPLSELKVAIEKRLSTNAFFLGQDDDVDNSYNKKNTILKQKEVAITITQIVAEACNDVNYIYFKIQGNLTLNQASPMFFLSNKLKKDRQTEKSKYFDSLKFGKYETYSANYPTITFEYLSKKYNYDREIGEIKEVEIIEHNSIC